MPKIPEEVRPKGGGVIAVFDQGHNLLDIQTFENIIVDEGRKWFRDHAIGNTSTPINYIGWGTDDSTPVSTNASLNNEILENEDEGVSALGDYKILAQGELSLTEGNGNTIKEVGIKASPYLINHSIDFDPIDKTDQKIIYLEVEIEIT
jgi:hypothetical protein